MNYSGKSIIIIEFAFKPSNTRGKETRVKQPFTAVFLIPNVILHVRVLCNLFNQFAVRKVQVAVDINWSKGNWWWICFLTSNFVFIITPLLLIDYLKLIFSELYSAIVFFQMTTKGEDKIVDTGLSIILYCDTYQAPQIQDIWCLDV